MQGGYREHVGIDLMSKYILHRRLSNAYPKLQDVKISIKEKKEEIKKIEKN